VCAECAVTRTAAAGGIAIINSIGNLGGFFAPTMLGSLRVRDGHVHQRADRSQRLRVSVQRCSSCALAATCAAADVLLIAIAVRLSAFFAQVIEGDLVIAPRMAGPYPGWTGACRSTTFDSPASP